MSNDDDTRREDEQYTVHVKAQVMTRDDSSGGWVPLGGGGVSVVGVRQQHARPTYSIYGRRTTDCTVVIDCAISSDLEYTRANPTFHHWRTESRRYGLAFQNSTDALHFERGIYTAINTLLQQGSESTPAATETEIDVSLLRHTLSQKLTSVELEPTTSTSEPERLVSAETVVTPLLPGTSRFSVPPPSGTHRLRHHPAASRRPVTRNNDSTPNGSKDTSKSSDGSSTLSVVEPQASTSVTDSGPAVTIPEYVEFASRTAAVVEPTTTPEVEVVTGVSELGPHEYCYTAVPPTGQSDVEAVMESSSSRPGREVARSRCLFCDEPFDAASNRRGACPDAPDCSADCVDRVSCLCCARAVVYHCLEPADDDSPTADDRDPCACDGGMDAVRRCRRWTSLSLLSVVVPCLCLYWPLAACHRCAVHIGCCGGRHSSSSRVVIV